MEKFNTVSLLVYSYIAIQNEEAKNYIKYKEENDTEVVAGYNIWSYIAMYNTSTHTSSYTSDLPEMFCQR